MNLREANTLLRKLFTSRKSEKNVRQHSGTQKGAIEAITSIHTGYMIRAPTFRRSTQRQEPHPLQLNTAAPQNLRSAGTAAFTRGRFFCAAAYADRLLSACRTAAGDLSAERLNHELQPVTDAEDRNAEFEDGRIALRRVFGINTRRAAGQDDALRALRPDGFGRRVERHDPAVHPAFTNPPRDQLTVLGAEIEDDDRFTHRGGFSFAKDGFLILFR